MKEINTNLSLKPVELAFEINDYIDCIEIGDIIIEQMKKENKVLYIPPKGVWEGS